MYYDANNYSFGNFALGACLTSGGTGMFSDLKIQQLLADAIKNAGSAPTPQTQCVANSSGWAVLVVMRTSSVANPKFWCVDGNGKAKMESTYIPMAGSSCF